MDSPGSKLAERKRGGNDQNNEGWEDCRPVYDRSVWEELDRGAPDTSKSVIMTATRTHGDYALGLG
jgi:hypothetical protein